MRVEHQSGLAIAATYLHPYQAELAKAREWLAANPDTLNGWLDGVTTKDGGDAMAALTAALAQ